MTPQTPRPPRTIRQTMGPVEWIMLLSLSALWGGSFFFVEVAVATLPPFTIVLLRVGLAAIALWAVATACGQRPPLRAELWIAFLGMGALNNAIPFSLIVWGQQTLASGVASILNATTPLFTVIVAGALLRDERATPLKLAGVATGFAGVAVMIGQDAFAGLASSVTAQAAVLAGAFSYACAGVFGRRFQAMGVHPLAAAAGQTTASTLLLAPIALAVDSPWTLGSPTLEVWASILGLALLSTALAYILYFSILARAGATNLLLVTFLIPVTAILLGALILNERLSVAECAGMALIGVGLLAIDGRLFRRRR